MYYSTLYASPLGTILLQSDGESLTGLRFVSQDAGAGQADAGNLRADAVLAEAKRWLDAYFRGQKPEHTLPVSADGSRFQTRVWEVLKNIPYGETVTYGDIARAVGCRSAQAVGNAVGKNPVAILVPCHRVVAAGNRLGGYAYGAAIKEKLLALEGVNPPHQ